MDRLDKFLFELRDTCEEVMVELFTTGSCLKLYYIVAQAFSDVEPWAEFRGHHVHVWIKWQGEFYDILGKLTEARKDTEYKGYGHDLKRIYPLPSFDWGDENKKARLTRHHRRNSKYYQKNCYLEKN